MNPIKKKILLDIFATPWTIAPTTIGGSLLLFSWGVGLGVMWGFVGFMGIVAGVGAVATNFLFNMEKIGERAIQAMKDEAIHKKETELDDLEEFLSKRTYRRKSGWDRDQHLRDRDYLRELRSVYIDFERDVSDGKISKFVSMEAISQLRDLYSATLNSLRTARKMWENAFDAEGRAQKILFEKWNSLMDDINKSVTRITETVGEMRTMGVASQNQDLNKLGDELTRSLEVARRTEQRIMDLEANDMREIERE